MSRIPVLNCHLERWCAWTGKEAPALEKAPAGGQWLPAGPPDVGFLPAMQRRRLSPLARSAFAVAWHCLSPGEEVPLLCSSADGEMQRTVALLGALAEEEPLSPTSFSLSVHNAIAGQMSIALGNQAAVLAIAPGDEGLAAAMVEACGLLAEGAEQVVVVWYDEPLPEPYAAFGHHEPEAAALAMRLGRGGAGTPLQLERHVADAGRGQPGPLPQLLAWLVSGQAEFETTAWAARWLWRRVGEAA